MKLLNEKELEEFAELKDKLFFIQLRISENLYYYIIGIKILYATKNINISVLRASYILHKLICNNNFSMIKIVYEIGKKYEHEKDNIVDLNKLTEEIIKREGFKNENSNSTKQSIINY